MRWDKKDIPHKGWIEIGMEDLGEEAEFGEEIQYEQCEMCGNEKIRYVHIMKHPEIQTTTTRAWRSFRGWRKRCEAAGWS